MVRDQRGSARSIMLAQILRQLSGRWSRKPAGKCYHGPTSKEWVRHSKSLLAVEFLEDRCVPSAAADAFGKLPLSFEPNVGQADAAVRYLSRGPGYALLLSDNEAVLHLSSGDPASGQHAELHIQLVAPTPTPP